MNLSIFFENLRPLAFFFLLIFPLMAAFLCLFISLRSLKASWALKDIPTSKIRSAAQGYIELSGNAQSLGNLLESKLKKKTCVWYHSTIEILKTIETDHGKEKRWEPVDEYKSIDPFIIKDDTGECVIFPDKAVVMPMHHETWVSAEKYPVEEKKTSFWVGFWNLLENLLLGANNVPYRHREYRLEEGDPIYVTGFFRTVAKEDSHLQENTFTKEYFNVKKTNEVNILSAEDLPVQYEFLVSSLKKFSLVKVYQRNALIYFIGFLLFCFACISTIYPIVMKSMDPDQYQQMNY